MTLPMADRFPAGHKMKWELSGESLENAKRLEADRRLLLKSGKLPEIMRGAKLTFQKLSEWYLEQPNFMVALGTHTALTPESILALYGITNPRQDFPRSVFYNHEWDRPDTFRRIGTLAAGEVEAISGRVLSEEVPIEINQTKKKPYKDEQGILFVDHASEILHRLERPTPEE
jgi:hypothetical protein